jgi:capsid protein
MVRSQPIRPDYAAAALRGGDAVTPLVRAAIATANNVFDRNVSASEFARRNWNDRAVEYVLRAAVSPATTTTPGWAQELSPVTLAFLASLVGPSAGADLLGRGIQLRFDGAKAISLPTIAPGQTGFVGEGKAIPVVQFQTASGVKLEPHKLALITTLTREMIESSNAEMIIRAVLSESAARGLDAALFSSNAGTADSPPGLLNGITPQTASTATPLLDAMVADLSALGGAVARVAGSNIVFVAAPEQALAVNLRAPDFAYSILASQLPVKTVIAIAAPALVSGFDPVPQIEASREPELHMDAAATDIVSGGGAVASPTMTLFQGDKLALKMRMRAAWALRAPSAIAFMQNVAW